MNIDEFTDPRDGRTYKLVVVNDSVWMAENLNYLTEGAFAYKNDANLRSRYGLLYTYEGALKAVPKGFRLPTEADWNELLKNAGGVSSAALILRGEGLSFCALNAGVKDFDGSFKGLGEKACFWSNETIGPFAYQTILLKSAESVIRSLGSKDLACSVRCVFDA